MLKILVPPNVGEGGVCVLNMPRAGEEATKIVEAIYAAPKNVVHEARKLAGK